MNNDSLSSKFKENLNCDDQLLWAASNILKTDTDHLQMISAVALKLLQLTQDEKARSSELSEIIATEPALVAKILQVVNSAAFSLVNNIESISHALSMIGFAEIRQIAIEQLLFNQFVNEGVHKRFDRLFFWQHCLFVACLSKQIAIDLGYPQPEIIYTAGLLHDIGKLVLENHGKVAYSDFLASTDRSDCPTDRNERFFFGLTHADIGHVFCINWNLPTIVTAVVAFHHDLAPEHSRYAEHNYETAIVCFADYIAWLQGIGASRNAASRGLPDNLMNIIDFRKLDFENLLRRVDQAMTHTSQLYGITFPDIQKLRASLVFAAIRDERTANVKFDPGKQRLTPLASLVSPHRSLDAKEIILSTLQAIHDDFAFDRVIMFGMSPNRTGLLAKHCWPKQDCQALLIPIEAIGGQLLKCLRHRTPVIINNLKDDFGKRLADILNIESFIAAPVLQNNRLVGVLYADYVYSRKPIDPDCLSQILPVANELGVALFHAKKFNLAKKQAEIDSLTQLFNKGKINQLLSEVYQHRREELDQFAIGFVDIDHFKKFNDLCGHQAGDDVLKIVAEILHSLSRPADFVGRYGGEEFLFALRQTSREGAYGYAERMRVEIEKRGKILSPRFSNLALTASIGIAMYHPKLQTYVEHVAMADQAMYRAKEQGRNRVLLIY